MNAAIGYVRVSTEEQSTSGLGLADQLARVAAYCRMRGLNLTATVEDGGVFGGRPLASRPGWAELLRRLDSSQGKRILISCAVSEALARAWTRVPSVKTRMLSREGISKAENAFALGIVRPDERGFCINQNSSGKTPVPVFRHARFSRSFCD